GDAQADWLRGDAKVLFEQAKAHPFAFGVQAVEADHRTAVGNDGVAAARIVGDDLLAKLQLAAGMGGGGSSVRSLSYFRQVLDYLADARAVLIAVVTATEGIDDHCQGPVLLDESFHQLQVPCVRQVDGAERVIFEGQAELITWYVPIGHALDGHRRIVLSRAPENPARLGGTFRAIEPIASGNYRAGQPKGEGTLAHAWLCDEGRYHREWNPIPHQVLDAAYQLGGIFNSAALLAAYHYLAD